VVRSPTRVPETDEEFVAPDDRLIGRVFRWSLILLVAVAAVVAAMVYLLSRQPERAPVREDSFLPPSKQYAVAAPPDVRFTDVTAAAGLTFRHDNGARGEKLLPETMGPGCAFFDYDNDGDPDILLVNGRSWSPGEERASTLALYANDEALELYARVLRTRPPPALAVSALCGRGTLLGVRGQLAEAATELERAIALCQQLGDDVALADALSRAAYVAYVSGDGPGILSRAEAAMRAAERTGQVRPRIAALRQLGIAHEFAGRFQAAEAAYRALLALDPAHGDEASAGALNSLGEIARARGQFAEATFLYRQAGVVAEALGLLRTTLVARANLGAALAESGEPTEALTVLDDAAREMARRGYHAFHAENRYYHALASLALGDTEGACRDAEEARRAAEKNGEAEMLGLCLRLEARLCEAGARAGDAERCLAESIETFARIGKPGEEARSRAALAEWLWRHGRVDPARAEAARARPVLIAMGRTDLAGALDAIG